MKERLLAVIVCCALAACGTALAQTTDVQVATVVVPIVGSVDGANGVRWRTDVELRNETRQEATVSLILPTSPEQPAIITTIPPGDSIRFTDIVGEAFGMEAALSPLIVQTLGRRSVTIRATAYGTRGAETFKPQPIAINYGSTYTVLRALQGLSFSDTFRTNIGLVNLSEREVSFVVALQRLPGRNLAVARVPLPPQSLWHAPIHVVFPLISGSNGEYTVVVEALHPDTYVYASVIENATNIARFVQPRVAAQQTIQTPPE